MRLPSRWIATAGTALVLVAFAMVRLPLLGVAGERNYDEGVYLLSARGVAHGDELFREVFSSQPPAFVETLALALRVGGDELATARLLALGFALLALAATAALAWRSAGPWAAPVAALALATGRPFDALAQGTQAEVPALALTLAAVLLVQRGDRRRVAAGGALFALALLFKLIVLPLGAVLALLLWRPDRGGEDTAAEPVPVPSPTDVGEALRRCGAFVLGGGLLVALVLPHYDPSGVLQQAVAFHLAKHDAYPWSLAANAGRVLAHLGNNALFVSLAAAGLVLGVRQGRCREWRWPVVWLLASGAALLLQSPLFAHHFLLTGPALAVAAGNGAACLLRSNRRGARLAAILGALLLALPMGRQLLALAADPAPHTPAAMLRIVDWIPRHTRSSDLVVSDDPMVVFLAGRRTPGRLCDTSQARIQAGFLTLEEATRETSKARLVVLRRGGRLSHLVGYREWLEEHYRQLSPARYGLRNLRSLWWRRDAAMPTFGAPDPKRPRAGHRRGPVHTKAAAGKHRRP